MWYKCESYGIWDSGSVLSALNGRLDWYATRFHAAFLDYSTLWWFLRIKWSKSWIDVRCAWFDTIEIDINIKYTEHIKRAPHIAEVLNSGRPKLWDFSCKQNRMAITSFLILYTSHSSLFILWSCLKIKTSRLKFKFVINVNDPRTIIIFSWLIIILFRKLILKFNGLAKKNPVAK